jgi:hypothetical protein
VVVGTVVTGIDVSHDHLKSPTLLKYLWDDALGYTDDDSTHLTGIVAGNGRASGNGEPQYQYVGLAPAANIVVARWRRESPLTLLLSEPSSHSWL